MIRAYVNRKGDGKGPVVVELWQDGELRARTFCQEVEFADDETRLVSVYGGSATGRKGFQGHGGPVHTWVESNLDHVSGMLGVTHHEGKVPTP